MRLVRPALALVAILSLTALSACAAAATPEEKAEQQFRSFVEATGGNGEYNWCPETAESNANESFDEYQIADGADVTVVQDGDSADGTVFSVSSSFHKPGDPDNAQESSVQVNVPDEGDACINYVYGFFH